MRYSATLASDDGAPADFFFRLRLAQRQDGASGGVVSVQAHAAVLIGTLVPADGDKPFHTMRPQLEHLWLV